MPAPEMYDIIQRYIANADFEDAAEFARLARQRCLDLLELRQAERAAIDEEIRELEDDRQSLSEAEQQMAAEIAALTAEEPETEEDPAPAAEAAPLAPATPVVPAASVAPVEPVEPAGRLVLIEAVREQLGDGDVWAAGEMAHVLRDLHPERTIRDSSVSKALATLVRQGKARRVGKGQYKRRSR